MTVDMQPKFYVTIAHCLAEYIQSDCLYLMAPNDGRLIGYSAEFEYGTTDIYEATDCEEVQTCVPERHCHVKSFGVAPELTRDWVPATLAEIKAHSLDKCLVGSKADMNPGGKVNPLE